MAPSTNPYLTVRISEDEKAILEKHCYDKRLTKTDAIKSYIYSLQPPEESENLWAITINLDPTELDILDNYCELTNQSRTCALHSLIRNIDTTPPKLKELLETKAPWESGDTFTSLTVDAASLRTIAEQILVIAERLDK